MLLVFFFFLSTLFSRVISKRIRLISWWKFYGNVKFYYDFPPRLSKMTISFDGSVSYVRRAALHCTIFPWLDVVSVAGLFVARASVKRFGQPHFWRNTAGCECREAHHASLFALVRRVGTCTRVGAGLRFNG
jgi:hypothetical protein